jgi:LmbE family N-acetylglucosaminyl deacetylase
VREGPEATARRRLEEARNAALVAGGAYHPPIAPDLGLFHDAPTLARAAAVVREIRPDLILTHSPSDYMEDHQNACRIVVTAAFARGMPNFRTDPAAEAWSGDTAIYHCLPHSLRDPLRRRLRAGQYVDVSSTIVYKREMLAQHRSQKEWLDASQGMDSYLAQMEEATREMGRLSGRFPYAEGWRRHLHVGFSRTPIDPLSTVLGPLCWTDPEYERALES